MNNAARTYLKLELANRIGKINGRSCAVGNDFLAVKYTADGRRMNIVRRFGESRENAISYIELWNGPEVGPLVSDGFPG